MFSQIACEVTKLVILECVFPEDGVDDRKCMTYLVDALRGRDEQLGRRVWGRSGE